MTGYRNTPPHQRPTTPQPTSHELDGIPNGYCQCGCGAKTTMWTRTDTREGGIRGQYRRYVTGHNTRTSPVDYLEQDCGYDTPCWVWQLSLFPSGYGQKRVNRRHAHAHRWYYEQAKGPIPEGLQLDHLCRVRACVNPDHLEPVTPRENVRRGLLGTATHCRNGHEYTDDNVRRSKEGWRRCQTCLRSRGRAAA